MNIALIGYGKMGKAIEQEAIQKGHTVVLKISTANRVELTAVNVSHADVAIEFSAPESAKEHVLLCLHAGIPVVCGSTGWDADAPEIQAAADKAAFLHASNFSIGMNIFFEINKRLGRLMNQQTVYDVSIEETHHAAKKDSPSGTAVTLARQLTACIDRKTNWSAAPVDDPALIPVTAFRIADEPGTHIVRYKSPADEITLIHRAYNREGFAAGAILAAGYVIGKKGIFTMQDVLGISV